MCIHIFVGYGYKYGYYLDAQICIIIDSNMKNGSGWILLNPLSAQSGTD